MQRSTSTSRQLATHSAAGRSFVAVAVLAAASCGCSGGRPGVDLVPVAGRVTCAGGAMPAAGRILFVPRAVEGGTSPSRPLRPGMATFAADGAFRATSWTPGDGLVPGTYAVVVECWKVPPTMDGPPAESHLAAAVGSAATTPLEVVVTAAGGPVMATFDVPPP